MCAECENQNGCGGTEWLCGYRMIVWVQQDGHVSVSVFILMTVWLTGSYGSLPVPSIMRSLRWTKYCQPGKRSKFTIWSTILAESVSLLHNCKAEKSLSQTIIFWGPFVYYQFMLYPYAYLNIIIVYSFALSLTPSVYIIF